MLLAAYTCHELLQRVAQVISIYELCVYQKEFPGGWQCDCVSVDGYIKWFEECDWIINDTHSHCKTIAHNKVQQQISN